MRMIHEHTPIGQCGNLGLKDRQEQRLLHVFDQVIVQADVAVGALHRRAGFNIARRIDMQIDACGCRAAGATLLIPVGINNDGGLDAFPLIKNKSVEGTNLLIGQYLLKPRVRT